MFLYYCGALRIEVPRIISIEYCYVPADKDRIRVVYVAHGSLSTVRRVRLRRDF